MTFHLAELNIARLHEPLGHEANKEFEAVLDAVNAIAEASDGFVWRLTDDNGKSSSYVEVYDDPNLIVNLSVWRDPDALRHFVYRSGHSSYLRRRKEWFADTSTVDLVCWWVPAGHQPSVEEAVAKLDFLRSHGPSSAAFPFPELFNAPLDVQA